MYVCVVFPGCIYGYKSCSNKLITYLFAYCLCVYCLCAWEKVGRPTYSVYVYKHIYITVCLVLNQSENGKYNLISVWFTNPAPISLLFVWLLFVWVGQKRNIYLFEKVGYPTYNACMSTNICIFIRTIFLYTYIFYATFLFVCDISIRFLGMRHNLYT